MMVTIKWVRRGTAGNWTVPIGELHTAVVELQMSGAVILGSKVADQ